MQMDRVSTTILPSPDERRAYLGGTRTKRLMPLTDQERRYLRPGTSPKRAARLAVKQLISGEFPAGTMGGM